MCSSGNCIKLFHHYQVPILLYSKNLYLFHYKTVYFLKFSKKKIDSKEKKNLKNDFKNNVFIGEINVYNVLYSQVVHRTKVVTGQWKRHGLIYLLFLKKFTSQ